MVIYITLNLVNQSPVFNGLLHKRLGLYLVIAPAQELFELCLLAALWPFKS